jgi:NADPH:quinone reductase
MGRRFAISTEIPRKRSPSNAQVTRAIRFETFGDPSVLELAEVPTPAADETTAMVRVMAASIEPSDVKNVAGAMKQTTL